MNLKDSFVSTTKELTIVCEPYFAAGGECGALIAKVLFDLNLAFSNGFR